MDLFLTGEADSLPVSKLYHNTDSGFTEVFAGTFAPAGYSAVAWGDYDNDGRSDILLTGFTGNPDSGFIARIYHNTDTGFSQVYAGSLAPAAGGSANWGDYDNDGKLDILITGFGGIVNNGPGNPQARIYHNTGSGFTEVFANTLPKVGYSSSAWGDYDNDGKLDILICGQESVNVHVSQIYHNTGSGFSLATTLPGLYSGSASWGDYDNDGKLDALISGGNAADSSITRLYRNTGAGFTEVYPGTLPGAFQGSTNWLDWDNDGRLDMAIISSKATKLFHNETGASANTKPTAPTGLQATVSGNGTVQLQWNASSDTQTPQAGLNYNLRVGTSTGSGNALSPLSDTAGFRRVVRMGNVNENTSWRLDGLPTGMYHWSVQAVDNAFAGSSFATEGTFLLTPVFTSNKQTVSFGTLDFGSTKADSIVVSNINNANPGLLLPLHITGVTLPAGYSVSPTTATVPAGGSATFIITCDGTVAGTTNRPIVFTSDAVSSPDTVIVMATVRGFAEQFAGTFPGVSHSAVAWGDFDNDGKLDLLLTGYQGHACISKIYHNTGAGFTEAYAGALQGVGDGAVAWGDYDNDGLLDLLITGDTTIGHGRPIARIYHNTGSSFTEVYAGILPGVSFSSVAWGDYNNDGRLDILLTGQTQASETIARIYRNTGSNFTEVYPGSLTGVELSAVAWGDYDNDGKLDILLSGYNGGSDYSKIYHNTGAGFTEVFAGSLSPLHYGSAAWGDYDNDGKLDILLTGFSNFTPASKIYHNTGAGFTEAYPGSLLNVYAGTAQWGDYDNDGKLDIMLSGYDGSKNQSIIYHNTGTGVAEVYSGSLDGVSGSAAAWGDYDNDGRLDLLVTGTRLASDVAKIYHNETGAQANTVPGPALGLQAVADGQGTATFSWRHATDAETPQSGLSYNLRIGRTPNTGDILSGMTDSITGYRRIVRAGTINDTTWKIDSLPKGSYTWAVQAIDNAFVGSTFVVEGTFSTIPAFSSNKDTVALGAFDYGTVKTDSIIVTNSNNALPLHITSIATPANMDVTPATATIAPGESATFIIQYGGEVVGTMHGLITFTSDASTSPDTVYVTATVRGFAEAITGTLPTLYSGSTAWGDYDNDGKLDLIITGVDTGSIIRTEIFHNTGSGFTEVFPGTVAGVAGGSVAWGDYDNDDKLDILITGAGTIDGKTPVSKIYHNTGSGFTEVYQGALTPLENSVAAWGDYDNDGRLDIAVEGKDTAAIRYSKIYHNTGSGFVEVHAGVLTAVADGGLAWGDFDNDGKLDILLCGQASAGAVTKIFRNTGSGFTEMYPGALPGVLFGAVACGDYDNDGKLDILLMGVNGDPVSQIYHNTGSGFAEVFGGSLSGFSKGSVAWGDYDNDGKPDILITGMEYPSHHPGTKVYHNTGSDFIEATIGSFNGVQTGSASWGDYDDDGRLDMIVAGSSTPALYHNETGAPANTIPGPVLGLHVVSDGHGTATLSWRHATDAETPQSGLSYNLRIGRTPNTGDILSGMTDSITGYRRIVRAGSINDTTWQISQLYPGSYTWAVQAIDNAFAGSGFFVGGTFTMGTHVIWSYDDASGKGTINPYDRVSVVAGSNQQFTITPAPKCRIDSLVIDGIRNTDSTTTYTFVNINANHTIKAYFSVAPEYSEQYRTFQYDSLIVPKAVKKKNITERWEFQIGNTTAGNLAVINLLFKNDVKEILSISHGFTALGSKKSWLLSGGTLPAGEKLVITGRSLKAKPQLLSKVWFGLVDKSPDAAAVAPMVDVAELPMPNAANVREALFAQAGFGKTLKWVIGKERTDAPKQFGWASFVKPADMYKSLTDKSGKHAEIGHGFLFLGNKKFLGPQSAVPPANHNDKTFADLLSLKFSILLSQLGITTPGLGELKVASQSSPYNDMLLRDIAALGDSMMTYPDPFSGNDYRNLDSILGMVNSAFSGSVDTLSWGDSLHLAGVKSLIDVPWLAPSGVPPTRIKPVAGSQYLAGELLPESYELEQNYPNPFNPTTTISFSLPVPSVVTLKVFNILGQLVTTLVDQEQMDEGNEQISFDASTLSSGVYFYRLDASSIDEPMTLFSQVKKMLLVR